MEAAGGAAALRAAFDELLVFEQDFDTAMQILMFQDEKVARLSLEDAEHARSRRRATRNRGAARSPSRKRRRTGASQSARADPPSPPLSGFTQSSETWSLTASAEASLVVDASASDFLAAATSTQMSENGKIAQENEVEESVALSAATQPAGGDMSGAGGAGRGGSSTMVTSLFTTGSGRAVSVSKERLQAYETKLQAAEESVALSAATQPAGGDMSGAGGAGRGGSSTMVTSLFTTGSGRAVSVSKERLQAYETKLQAAEESVALSAATQPAGGDMSGAGGAGRGGSSTMVTSLFTTGSGRAVSVSKERLQAYETKLQAAEESVALSAATQPAGGDMSGAGGAGRDGSSTMVTSLFTTGSGRAVSVSKERLQAYETKLQAAEESVALSAATQPAGGDMSGAGGAGRDGSSTMVTSLFTTGSGRAVSVSKERLQAYETKLQAAEESVALSAATQPAGGDMSGAGGAGRGGSSTMVTSLFTTGSGRAVSVSKERLQAYETKLQAAEESVALSAATQPAGGDMSGAGGAGRDGSSTMVTSLFTTGSGRAVSVSKERLQAYETKLQAAEESVALSAATQPAGGDMSGAGGAGRGGSSTMVTSLFTTGSGRAVSVSKERLQAYETKLQAAEESVALSAATQPAGGDMSGAGGAGRDGSSTMVTSLFTTGSGRAVSVSKERLQAYETKLQAAEESVALSAATQPAGGDMSGAGGAGRGGSSTMVTSLFTTGSGRAVSVSKERLQAYETKLQAAEESVALSAATQPAGGDMSGAGGAGRGGSSTMVTSLFTTGSGRAVSVSKERLQAYETKLQAAEESVALSAATQPAGGDMSGAGGAGRGGSSTMVTSLFTTGSGRAVSVSKERLQAYETKLQAAEESVALSAATQPAGGDMSGAGGAGRDGSSTMVTSLFTTGSGRAVSVSKERLQAYETKLQAAEESVALSAATQPAGGDMSGAGGAGRDGSSTMVTSLFTTGSGRAVSVSKERLQAYETKLQAAEESVALSAATQPAGGDMSGAGGAGRGGSSTMVTSLFTTGSGRAVSVSKERLQAYETKLQAAEESVALSAATQPAGGDMSGAGGAGRDGSSTMVTSLFTTGSGRAVSVSKERLQAYETKLQAAEESVALSAATQPAGGDMSGAGGAGRGGSSTMVTSLFTTGSGRAVSVSKERLQAYETKLQAAEESVALSAATQPAGGDMSGAGGAGRGGSSTMVTSLFTTGSGRAVSVSKERLQAYETKLQAAEESVALSAATQPAGGDMSGAGGAGRGGSSTMVTSLFTTGSGRAVSVSKERLQAYETKLQAAEESVALSAATQPAGGDMSGAGGAGRGGSSTMVTSLFTTGSGRAVSVSKERLQAYETKLQAAEESVALSAATQPAGGDMSGAGGAGRGGSSTMVTSLFTTGSGRAVSVSKERLQAYETKLQAAEESVALSAATQPAGGDMSGAGGAGRGGSSTMVTSLFTTGSGRAVSVSKERLQAYETKLQAAEESVTLSAVRQLCDVDDNTRVGNVGAAGSEGVMDKEPWTASSLGDSPGESSGLLRAPLNEFASFNGGNGAAVSSVRSRLMTNPSSDIPSQHARGADKENVHPENVLVRQTAALEASKWQASLGSKQLNCRLTSQTRGQQRSRQQQARRPLKPSVGSRTSLSGTKRFRPPVASKKKLDNVASKGLGEPCVPTAPMNKKQKTRRSEGRPFIYEETMKISFSLLMALREDRELDQEMTGGGCDMSRFQVLDSITAENALDVRFTHDGRLVCSPQSSDDATIGPRELYRQLRAGNYILKSTGATFAWFLNHYRWIVWKLAATERSFPRLLMEKYLTKDQSLKQVMHRYERDLNNAQGSIVKKILQRDASSLSCMVLCVAAVLPFPAENNTAVDQELPPCWNMALVLTDGWYSVYAVPDAPLATVLWKLHSKSNLVGTKLATWNASLQNSTEGIDPLECAIVRESHWKNPLLAKEDLTQWPYLQLRYNSTRRVRFDTRLGVEKLHYVTPATSRHRKQQPQLTFSLLKSVPLKSLEVGGGMIRSVRVRVLRVSPVLHLQSKEWTLGPRIICEDQLPLYYQLRSEYARMAMQKNHKGDDGDMMMDEWSGGDNQIDVPPPIPFIKVDVECTHPCANENQGVGCGILTIWRPSEELLSGGLKEGVEYFASSLTVNWKLDGGRGQDASLRLSSTKHSGFEEIPEEDAMTDGVENGNTQVERSRRACVDVQQATTDYRTNFENGLDGRRNEKRPTIDVCVCVVLVTGRETQDESSVAAKRQAEVSLLDPALKPKESRYVEHVFVTDQSGHLMSIRVSGMEVTMPKTKAHSPLKRGSSSSFVFRRGNKNIWKEGAILCLSGLEVSHYDEQLRVLDCVLVESTQIVSFPSKKSPFWDNFHALQRELGVSTARGPPSQAPSSNFAGELTQLKKYVERDILRMDFVPSQEYTNEHHIEVVEQERLTQDLQAHVEGGETIANDQGETESTPPNRHLRWDGSVVKVLPLLGSSKVMFPRDVVAFACLNMKSDDKAFRTVYLTRELLKTMKSLLLEASTHAPEQLDEEKESQASETDFALVQSVTRVLAEIKQHTADSVLRFEVRQSTNERLINSWKPWERLHASNWMGVAVSTASTSK